MEEEIVSHFAVKGNPVFVCEFGEGHINRTYLCTCDTGISYILQCINHHVFEDPEQLMENVSSVAKFLNERIADPRKSMRLVPTNDGKPFIQIGDEYWRMYEFVPLSICLQRPENDKDLYYAGVAFGTFQHQLADYPAETLHDTIKNFHNTRDRYRQFHEALQYDLMNRAKDCEPEIEFVLAREDEAGQIVDLLESGQLPTRVTHNDTKLNNVLFDFDTRQPLCVIDLDNVMAGSVLYDFGDTIRFGASTAAEDEQDLSKVELDPQLFRQFTKGFLEGCGNSLTPLEIEMLPVGAKMMMLECGTRFLTDYLNGDTYFRIHREHHNLDRARAQLKLVESTENQMSELSNIVDDIVQRLEL